MQDFRQLDAWKRAHQLVLRIYTLSNQLPPSENFGLVLHLRRTAIAIPQAIAVGAGRTTNPEFAIELRKARASGQELEYILLLCHDLKFFTDEVHAEHNEEVIEVRKMISGLLKRVSSTP